MSMIVDKTFQGLQDSLDLRLRRQELINSNLANLDTPHFQPSDLEFEGALKVIIGKDYAPPITSRTSFDHMAMTNETLSNADQVVERPDVLNSLDGNGVDLDREMGRLTENSVRYSATIEMSRRRVGIMNYTIMKMGEPA